MKKEQNHWIPFVGLIFMVIAIGFSIMAYSNTKVKTPAPIPQHSATIQKVEAVEDGFDFKTPALYFFSAVAQTMGALLAITFTVLFTQLNSIANSKKDVQRPIVPAPPEPLGYKTGQMFNPAEMEYERRKKEHEENKKIHYEHYIEQLINERLPIKPIIACLVKDSYLQDSLMFGLTSILTSVSLILIMLAFKDNSSFTLLTIVLIFGAIIISLCVLSILRMIAFLSSRYHLFSNKYKLVKENTDKIGRNITTKNRKIAVSLSEIMLYNPNRFSVEHIGPDDNRYYFINNIFNTFKENEWEDKLTELADVATHIEEAVDPQDLTKCLEKVTETLTKGCIDCMHTLKVEKKVLEKVAVVITKLLCEYVDPLPGENNLRSITAGKIAKQIGNDGHMLFSSIFLANASLENLYFRRKIQPRLYTHCLLENYRKNFYNGDPELIKSNIAKGLYITLIERFHSVGFGNTDVDNLDDSNFIEDCYRGLMELKDEYLNQDVLNEINSRTGYSKPSDSNLIAVCTLYRLCDFRLSGELERKSKELPYSELITEWVKKFKKGLSIIQEEEEKQMISRNEEIEKFSRKMEENND